MPRSPGKRAEVLERGNGRLTIEEVSLWRQVRDARLRLADAGLAQLDVLTARESACLLGVAGDVLDSIVGCGHLEPVRDPPPWAPKQAGQLFRLSEVELLARRWDSRGAPDAFAATWAERDPRPNDAGVLTVLEAAIEGALDRLGLRITEDAIARRSRATLGEAAALLGVTRRGIRKIAERGDLVEIESAADTLGRSFDLAALAKLQDARSRRSRQPRRA